MLSARTRCICWFLTNYNHVIVSNFFIQIAKCNIGIVQVHKTALLDLSVVVKDSCSDIVLKLASQLQLNDEAS